MDLVRNIVDVAEGIATVAAIFGGGIWAYLVFVRTRQKFPRANISHDIRHYPIGNEKVLLHIDVTITNVGDVLLSIIRGQTRVQQILPLTDAVQNLIDQTTDPVENGSTEVNWPLACETCDRVKKWVDGEFEIEPKETDQLNYDFIIDADITAVEVYSYFTNTRKRKREIGWGLATVYDLHEDKNTPAKIIR